MKTHRKCSFQYDRASAGKGLEGETRGRYRRSLIRNGAIISLAVLLCIGAASVAFWGEPNDRCDPAVGGAVPSPLGDVIHIGNLSTPGANGTFTMKPGYVYRIEIAGGAGGNSVNGSSGGNGAVIAAWFDMGDAAEPVVYSYSLLSGGKGGIPIVTGGWFGGSGGYSIYITDENGTAMMVAGGGGGGGANGGGGGSAGLPGASGVSGQYATSTGGKGGTQSAGGAGGAGTVNGNAGGGIGNGKGGDGGAASGAYGGGGGGSGYTGGGGGAGVSIGGAGGGGGGSSYVHKNFVLESSRIAVSSTPVKVAEYVAHEDIKITASDEKVTYDGAPHGISATVFPECFGCDLNITYSCNGCETGEEPVCAGVYEVTVSLSNDKCETCPVKATLTICPALLPMPYAPVTEYTYTGSEITLGLTDLDDDTMDVTGSKGTYIGAHNAIISLLDPLDYHWNDGNGNDGGIDDINIAWNIAQIEAMIYASDRTVTYDGMPHSIDAAVSPECQDGVLTVRYVGDGYDDTAPPVSAGMYEVTITTDCSVCSASPVKVTLTILPALLTRPTAPGTEFDHTGSEITLALNGFDDTKMGVAGNTGTDVGVRNAIISLLDTLNFRWDDGSGNDGGIDDVIIEWSIASAAGTGGGDDDEDNGDQGDDDDQVEDDDQGDDDQGEDNGDQGDDDDQVEDDQGKGALGAIGGTGGIGPWPFIPFLALLLLLLAAFGRMDKITGKVSYNGAGIAGARVIYTANGKTGSVTTGRSGRYVIYVRKGSAVTIASASGNVAQSRPVHLTTEKRITELDISIPMGA